MCAGGQTCLWTSAACRAPLIMSAFERSSARFSSFVSRHRWLRTYYALLSGQARGKGPMSWQTVCGDVDPCRWQYIHRWKTGVEPQMKSSRSNL